MRKVQAKPITNENFAPYGQFYTMDDPKGYALRGELHAFYPDRINADSAHRVGYSPIVVNKPDKMIITQQEYHTTAEELILPLDDDMILHVAPASGGTIVTDHAKAFLVPKGTLVKLKAAVWHLAPLPASKERLIAMIILPECTYANDCPVIDLPAEEQFEIVR